MKMNSNANGIALVIGYNNGFRLGLNHDENITSLTEWTKPNKHIHINQIHLSESGLIIHDTNGHYWGMGKNGFGECGINQQTQFVKQPQHITYFNDNNIEIKSVHTTVTGMSTFWVTSDNKVYGNGKNDQYELGIADGKHKFAPTLIQSLENVKKICCSFGCSIAMDYNGNVYTTKGCKRNLKWRLKSTFNHKQIVDISCGGRHSLYLRSNGNLYASGDNIYGQLGSMDVNQKLNTISYFKHNGIKIKQMACGWNYNLLLDDAGNVWSWGRNNVYQCGIDNKGYHIKQPQVIQALKESGYLIIDIKCGYRHSYVLSEDNKHLLFGSNKYNECCCLRSSACIKEPTCINKRIEDKTNGYIKAVYLGNDNTMILVSDAHAYDMDDYEEEKRVTLPGLLSLYDSNDSSAECPPGYVKKCEVKSITLTAQSIALLEDEINDVLSGKETLQNELNELENECNAAKRERDDLENKCNKLQRKYDNTRELNMKQKAALNRMKKKHKTLESELEEVQSENQELQENNCSLKSVHSSHQRKITKMHKEYKSLEAEHMKLKNKLEKISNCVLYGKVVPPEFCCPISFEIMHDPVIAYDGHTYNRASIEEWLLNNNTSPITREKCENKMLITNRALKYLIDGWKKENAKTLKEND